MSWTILLDWRFWLGAAFVGLGFYAALQHLGWEHEKTAFAQFRADTERLGAEAKVKAAQERAREAHNAQEAIGALQTRFDALSARYSRLRASPGGGGVPDLASAAGQLGTCPGKPDEPDAAARFLAAVESRAVAIFETGDREIAKLVELYRLDQKNAAH